VRKVRCHNGAVDFFGVGVASERMGNVSSVPGLIPEGSAPQPERLADARWRVLDGREARDVRSPGFRAG
jgi:hypothetical protein